MIGNRKRLIGMVGALTVLAGQLILSPMAFAEDTASAEKGKEIAFDRIKGNCLACHSITGGASPGNIAPALIAIQSRFANKAELRSQIWDAGIKNPETAMPPFGKYGALSEQEIDVVVEYVWNL